MPVQDPVTQFGSRMMTIAITWFVAVHYRGIWWQGLIAEILVLAVLSYIINRFNKRAYARARIQV